MSSQPISPIDFQILLALADTERHGYGIMREVSERSNETVRLGPGTLYGALKRLIAGKMIEESDERPDPAMDDKRRRCYYRLTPQGRQVAVSEAERLVSLVQVAQVKKMIPPGVSTS